MPVTHEQMLAHLVARQREENARYERIRERAVAAARTFCQRLVVDGEATDAWLIGSAAWGAFGDRSDLDVVVRGLAPEREWDVADALAVAADIDVDLLRWETLGERFRARVEREGWRLA